MNSERLFVRLVFENGVELRRTSGRSWSLQAAGGKQVSSTPTEVEENYDVRPILVTERLPTGYELTLLLSPIIRHDSFNSELSQLHQKALKKPGSIAISDITNLVYIVGAVLHHCRHLAEVYSAICRHYASFPFPQENEKAIFGNQEEPFYELEALVTQARRSYKMLQVVVWHAYGLPHGRPNSFERVLALCEDIPTNLEARLSQSWRQYGSKLKDYRDCIHHYVPLTRHMAYAWMTKLEGETFSTSILIPDNPEARSQKLFRYDSQLDALTYGWELANEVLEITGTTISEVVNRESR